MKKLIFIIFIIISTLYFCNANSQEQKINAYRNMGIFGISNFFVSTGFFVSSNIFLYKSLNYQLSSFEYESNNLYFSSKFNYPIVQALLYASVILSSILMLVSIIIAIVGFVYSYLEYQKLKDMENKEKCEIPILILKIESN